MDNVRAYNQMFNMTSFGARIDETINDGRSPYVFKVSGQIYHWIGSLCPQLGTRPRFLQLYIYDTDSEVENRMAHFGGGDSDRICEDLVRKLIHLLDSHNELVRLFWTARDKCNAVEIPTFKIRLFSVTGSKQHSLPTSDAIGAIVFDTGFHPDLKLVDAPGFTGGRYVVTVYCSIELDRMDYIRKKQKDIRKYYLSGLYDTISRGDQTGSDVGSRTILPASFTGGPRYMYSHYLDALPFPQLTASDRADIVARVFRFKVKEFVAFLKDGKPLGDFRGVMYTNEFQKRGLPHCHTLVWLHSSSSSPMSERIDDYISAELPDLRTHLAGYAVISTTMMHGPCGIPNLHAPCMEGPTCTQKFPKKYNDKTFFDADGRAHYRRRNTGVYNPCAGVHLDNSYVVPYNRLLCMTFQAHINVE
ncbi:uncharacterized protein [Rutidosis leptorrhynchoides]|uniref:uncharacterized protein n=1 Tax=Rutidosis leptorrhynchoides TaxID=125765 RepID=UPI003A99DE51